MCSSVPSLLVCSSNDVRQTPINVGAGEMVPVKRTSTSSSSPPSSSSWFFLQPSVPDDFPDEPEALGQQQPQHSGAGLALIAVSQSGRCTEHSGELTTSALPYPEEVAEAAEHVDSLSRLDNALEVMHRHAGSEAAVLELLPLPLREIAADTYALQPTRFSAVWSWYCCCGRACKRSTVDIHGFVRILWSLINALGKHKEHVPDVRNQLSKHSQETLNYVMQVPFSLTFFLSPSLLLFLSVSFSLYSSLYLSFPRSIFPLFLSAFFHSPEYRIKNSF